MSNFLGSGSGRFENPCREDPVFGHMRYMGDRLKYWEGKTNFRWAESDVEVFVDDSARGDMERQHEFFGEVSAEWPNLRNEVLELLKREWRHWNPGAKGDPSTQFTISSMTIPDGSLESAEWEISFAVPDRSHLYTVRMKGRMPFQVVVE